MVSPSRDPLWHHGRRAWDAIDAAAFAHLAAVPADETYRRLLASSPAREAEQLVAA